MTTNGSGTDTGSIRKHCLYDWVLTFLILLFNSAITGQTNDPYRFKRLNIDDGLPAPIVTDIIEDHDGFIWIGTVGGLARFDGAEFTTFRQSDAECGLAFDNINDLALGPQGKVYMTYRFGWSIYDPETQCFKNHLADSTLFASTFNYYNSILPDDSGRIWLGTSFGIECFDTRDSSSRSYSIRQGDNSSFPDSAEVVFLEELTSDEDVLVVAARGGLAQFNKITGEFTFPFPLVNGDWEGILASSLLVQNDTSIYMGLWGNGLADLDMNSGTWHLTHSEPGLRHRDPFRGNIPWDVVHALTISNDGKILAGYGSGLGIYDPEFRTLELLRNDVNDTKTLSSDGILCLYTSPNGRLYVGTNNGLNISEPSDPLFERIDPFSRAEPPAADIQLYARPDGAVWYSAKLEIAPGTVMFSDFVQGGISVADLSTHTVRHYPAGNYYKTPRSFISAIRLDTNEVLLSSQDDLWVLDLRAMRITPWDSPLATVYRNRRFTLPRIIEFGNDQFAVYRHYDLMLSDSNGAPRIYGREAFGNVAISSVHTSPRGELFVWAGNQGYRLDTGSYQFDSLDIDIYVKGGVDNALFSSSEDLWVVGSNSGLHHYRYRNKAIELLESYTTADGLLTNALHKLSIDAHGNLWGGSSSGIFMLDPETEFIRNYTKQDGIVMAYIDEPILFLSDGSAFCDDRRYLYHMKPDYSSAFNGKCYIKALTFDDTTFTGSVTDISLPHNFNTLTASLGVIDHKFGDRDQVYYLLEGLESGWNLSGTDRLARYTNLRPGKYNLRIKARDPNGNYSDEISREFVIRAAIYQRSWFVPAVIVLLIGLAWLVYRQRIRTVKRTEAERAAFNKKVAELELKALRSQMNPHFMFNSLNSIKNYILQSQPEKASEYLSSFAHLIRLILQHSREQTITLQEELDTLLLYIDLEKLRFRDGFKFNCTVGDQVDLSAVKIPPLILQPYVENAIWHGLLHKEEDRELSLEFVHNSNSILCIIDDNGIGRAHAAELKSKSATRYKSMGMGITDDRITIINELDALGMHVEILDKTDAEGKPSGTRVIVTIPYENHPD